MEQVRFDLSDYHRSINYLKTSRSAGSDSERKIPFATAFLNLIVVTYHTNVYIRANVHESPWLPHSKNKEFRTNWEGAMSTELSAARGGFGVPVKISGQVKSSL